MSARRRQHGAALLMAMIIVALVATLAGAMVWQQWRSVQVETAERGRAQSSWILTGALDWSQLILKEDRRADANKGNDAYDGLDEPWATPLAEARLSTFLAADASNADDGPEAFLSGDISDAQARFNVMNLLDMTDPDKPEVKRDQLAILKNLCNFIDVSQGTADLIANGLRDARRYGTPSQTTNPPVMPKRIDQLAWFGADPAALKRLEPFLFINETPTKINVNTASRELIAAAIPGLNLGDAESLMQARKSKPFSNMPAITKLLPPGLTPTQIQALTQNISWVSSFFIVSGRMRVGDRVLEQKALVERVSVRDIRVLTREDISLRETTN